MTLTIYPKSMCRVCGFNDLEIYLELGLLPISGKFSFETSDEEKIPLSLARCKNCGLNQLYHKLPTDKLYGPDYGYESHLNISMVDHLQDVATSTLNEYFALNGKNPRIVLDIASNDGTLLSKFSDLNSTIDLYGIDPLIENFLDHYPKGARLSKSFFPSKNQIDIKSESVSIITSLSVFYDLDNPVDFAREVWNLLELGGIWHLEQSYFPLMLKNNSFDTICHEHFLYLRCIDFKNIFSQLGFSVVSCKTNDINGGSIALTVQKSNSSSYCLEFNNLVNEEVRSHMVLPPGRILAESIRDIRINLRNLLLALKSEGFKVVGLGASTKGNILLNVLDLNCDLIDAIGEINAKKFGKITPGSHIPIIPETELLNKNGQRQAIVILPWHFRETFLEKTRERRALGDKVIFPLPEITVIE